MRYTLRFASFLSVVLIMYLCMGFSGKGHDALYAGKKDTGPLLRTVPVKAPISEPSPTVAFEAYLRDSYQIAGLDTSGLPFETYREAVTGYHNLMDGDTLQRAKALVTIVDLNQSSRNRRLWVIDLAANRVVFNTWVSHGQGSGGEFATSFSNIPNSNQSSLGFYLTQGTYLGGNGNSLKLQGMDPGFNTNALQRFVVVHGAAYANGEFLKANGRLGRSQGCPALPLDVAQPIIETIKDRTVLYIDGPSDNYTSSYLDMDKAALCLRADQSGKEPLRT